MNIGQSTRIDPGAYLKKSEIVKNGFGVFSLVSHRDHPQISFFLFELDGFQSCCQRDWLSFRWSAPEMQGAVVRMAESRKLVVWKDLRHFGGLRPNVSSLAAWADQVVARMEEIRLSRS